MLGLQVAHKLPLVNVLSKSVSGWYTKCNLKLREVPKQTQQTQSDRRPTKAPRRSLESLAPRRRFSGGEPRLLPKDFLFTFDSIAAT